MTINRRATTSQDSSLDLFLDTICNAFGAIMFLSILLALLVQLREKTEAGQARASEPTARDEEALRQQIEHLRAQLEISERSSALRPEAASDLASELTQREAEIRRLEETLDQLLDSEVASKEQLESMQQSIAEQLEDLERIPIALAASQKEVQEAAASLDQAIQKRTKAGSWPEVRNTAKRNLGMLLRFGCAYWAFDNNGLTGLPTFNDQDIKVIRSGSSTSLSPIAGQGWDLGTDAGIVSVNAWLATREPNSEVITVAVWPDSYGVFSELKLLLIERGLGYELLPLDDVSSIEVGPSTQATTRTQ